MTACRGQSQPDMTSHKAPLGFLDVNLHGNFVVLLETKLQQSISKDNSATLGATSSSMCEISNFALHYYVHVPNQDDSTYELGEKKVSIDLDFEAHLQ